MDRQTDGKADDGEMICVCKPAYSGDASVLYFHIILVSYNVKESYVALKKKKISVLLLC